ncbi:hypothetical protein DFH28DRAFT_901718 [Melampsora americana]|nr:hypothetical protein DFH28DRAFT_901718 [Melampsora americana]
MFLNYSFIGVCLLFGTLSQAIPIIKSDTFKVFQTRSIHQRDSTPSNSFHLIDEEKPKIENKVKIETVKSVDGRLPSEEISIDLKKPFDDLNSDHKLTGMAKKSVVESLSDQKHSETNSKLSKALTLERRQNHKSSSYLSEEEKSTIAKSRTETRAKIDAVIDAGGEITIEEISVVSKEAIAENENSDRKTIGKAIKNAVEDLADRKLAELKDKSSREA